MITTRWIKPALAFFMSFLMLFGLMPIEVSAQAATPKPASKTVIPYVAVDGENIPIDDERIQNHIVIPPRNLRLRTASNMPDVSGITALSGNWSDEPTVTMGGTTVSAQRYIVTIDGVGYEAFCADPTLRGPERSDAMYEIKGEAHPQLLNALRNGYPLNTEWSSANLSNDERMALVYITRVAVAIANNPTRTFAGDTSTIDEARRLAEGEIVANHDAFPPIMVNGTKEAEDTGRIIEGAVAQSEAFNITHNRKTNSFYNRFRFEWDSGTPAGTKLIVDGNVIATAPTNPDTIFRDDITSFRLEMPNEYEFEGQEARINLVGLHNDFAGKIWLLQNSTNPDSWQDIVFYIPEVKAGAVFSFETMPEPDEAALRIIKRNPGGQGLAGAVFNITGPAGYSETRTTPQNGTILLQNLDPGEYTVTETSPPPGHSLANPSTVTVTIAPGNTGVIERIFVNPPETEETETGVRIQKIDALTRENIPGALIRLRGMSSHHVIAGDGQHWHMDNTGINLSQVLTAGATVAVGDDVVSTVTDGVWTITGLPYGFYSVEEERAPENYSLLPQHTAYSFWLNPPDVTVALNVVETQVVIPWDDVLAMLEELAGANTPADDLQAVLDIMTAALGAVELVIIPVYDIGETPNTSSVLITFENYPFGEIEVLKIDSVTGQPLAGAHIRIQGYFPEGNNNGIPVDRVEITGSDGRIVFDNLPAGNYTLSEIYAPPGYVLSNEFRSVPLTWGQRNSVTFYNQPKTWLEVIKVDGNDGTRLAGARFELVDPTTGERWEAESGGNGVATLGQAQGSLGNELLAGKTYILTELSAPNGYVLISEPISVVLRNTGVNTITVENFRNPTLTIVKRDKNNGQPRLEGAVFEVNFENGQTVSGSPFTTNANGEIVINEILFDGDAERTLIITEIIPPDGYNLSDPNWRRVTVRMGEDNVIVFENTRKPTLEIHKVDAITGQNLAGAEFTIEKLEDPGRGMLTGNPFTTDANGRIILQYQYSGKYRIVETQAPNNYWLDPLQQNREWIIEIKDNEDYTLRVENTLLPTLIITKWNAVTYRPVPLTHFRVEYEVPNSSQVQLVGEFVTNQNGQIVIPYTRVGWYRITETRAAPGMSLNTNNSYRVYLNPGDNSYMPIPDVTGNNPGLNQQMPVFRDIRVFGGNDFFVGGAQQHSFPQNSIVIQGTANETFTVANQNNAIMPMSNVQVNINAHIVGEFSADSSGFLVLDGLENAIYAVTNSEGRTETAALLHDGSIAHFNFTSASSGEPSEPEEPTEPPASPDVDTGTPYEGDIDIVDDPALVSQITANMSVNNGQQYWNSGHGIWNWPLNSIVIKKQDATNGNLLAGATFNVIYTTSGESGTKGTVIGRFTTDFSGIIVITGLEPGNYVIEEEQPPPNYTLSTNNRQNVNLKPDGTSIVEVTFSNLPYGSLLIHKADSVTRAPLAGAEFLVRDSRGTVVGTSNGLFTTDASGNILISKLPPDTYVVTEQRAPNGYVIGPNATQTIMVQPDGRVYRLEFTNDPLSSLIIRKIDSFDGSPLAGARFEVRRVNGEFIGEYTTDQQGLITVPNILGWFTVTEMEAPPGFAMDTNNPRTVEVRSQAPTYVTFYNPREGSLTIEKIDDFGSPLSGAQFRITRQNGEFVANHTTGASGMITLSNLSAGWYFVEETRAPNGYVISQAGQSIEVRPNSAAHVTFVNLPQPTLTIQKLDETGNPLIGARFMVSQIGGSFSREVTIGAGGTASLVLPMEVPEASFQIVETQAPQGYVITEPARVITVRAGENRFESFVNYRTPSLIINKLDVDGNPLSGAQFEVRTLSGALVATATSNNGGIAAIGSIAPGNYQVMETRAPAGFVITEQSQIIQIVAGDTATLTFVNERMPGLTIEKVDENGHPLQGAEFEVRTLAGALVQRVTTNNGGIANIAQIEAGAYTITETRAPAGFVLTEVSRNVQITAGQSITERFVNYRQPSLVIEKIDENGSPLSGAVFEVRTLAGARVAEVTTNAGGMAIVAALAPGSYEIIETRPPSGFVVTEISRAIQILPGESRTERFVNHRMPALVIEKVDENGQPLAGAEFEVRTLGGNLIERVVTNNGGTATIARLDPGAYEIIETRAPEGFAIVEVSRAIQIVAGQTLTERFVNPRLATFIIQKIDGDTGEPLTGVVFEVTTLEGEHVRNPHNGSFEFITDNAGMIRLPMLEAGSYVAVETKTLPGYVLAPPEVFVVAHDRDYIITVRNYRLPDYNILKIDGNTNEPLAGVQFELAHYYASGRVGEKIRNPQNGSFTWTTDSAGLIRFPNLEHGTYIATEIRPLPGYRPADPAIFVVSDNEPTTITIRNFRFSEWNILKLSGDTGQPLQGVVFEVAHYFGDGSTGDKLRNSVTGQMEFTTNADGLIRLGVLEPGTYIVTETQPLAGYIPAEPTVFVVTENDVNTTVTIRNYKLPTYVIRKIDGENNQPLPGVVFEIARYFDNGSSGERVRNPINGSFEFVTDEAGLITLPTLPHAAYVAIETQPLNGYAAAEPHVFVVGDNQNTTITIRNYRNPDFTIRKLDGDTQEPLQGVQFKIYHYLGGGRSGEMLRNPADGGYIWTTDRAGLIHLNALAPGNYIAAESRPLPGYSTAPPKTFTVGGENTTITIYNHRLPDYTIQKVDGDTNQPLAGVAFEIAHYLGEGRNGERLVNPANGTTTFVTDDAGMIHLPSLEPGMYVATETRPLSGYVAAEPTVFTVGEGQNRTIVISNYKRGETVIRKIDGDTDRVLPGVVFEIRRLNGERVQNPINNTFEFTTDNAGLIPLGFLTAGTYVATELRPLEGYTAGEPTTFEVKDGEDLTVIIRNYKQTSLTVRKINSVTRSPIEGVVFQLSQPDGQRVVNPQTGVYDFVTDNRGLIYLPALPDGTYWLTEIRPADGYIGLAEPILLNINRDTRQRSVLLEVENQPASGLLIIKTDAKSGRPLEGVVFDIRSADGSFVFNRIQDQNQPGTANNSPHFSASHNGAVMGSYTTDHRGRIQLNYLEPGVYYVTETKARDGYQLDTTVHTVTIRPGEQAILRVENAPLAGLRLLKIDSITQQPIFNVEFMVFDHDGKVVGNFYTDNNGLIDFSAILAPGRYTIRETRPAPGYSRDDVPRTVEFIAGRVTEVIWENTPIAGQLQILKLAGDDNFHNGLPTGTPLAGAIFEIYEARTGNLVDRIASNERGMAVSRPLPLGRYIAREVAAPMFYRINPQEIHFEIEFESQIVRMTFPNFSANMGVSITKRGPQEAMQGHNIVYDIHNVRNDSTVPLADFYWRDILPVEAVRADKLITGTYNANLRYRILATTNRGNEIVVADNLSTLTNNVVEMRPVHLGLASNEYIVNFTLYFGQVPAGFTSVERPRIFVDVLPASHTMLPNGQMFANRVDVGGRVVGTDEWVIGNSTTATTIFNPSKLPRSGF